MTCLLVSHLTWTNKIIQNQMSKREVIRRLISLCDFNELVNESDPESSLELL
jgi:hypothetical protein